jgi:cytochrome b involved in lipid metabolism
MTPIPNTRSHPHQEEQVNNETNNNHGANEKRLEILFEGNYYDVTHFIQRHPGGNVIKFYTEKGEDATQAIQQFHNRSIHQIHIILKSFKKRPALDNESKTSSQEKTFIIIFQNFQT